MADEKLAADLYRFFSSSAPSTTRSKAVMAVREGKQSTRDIEVLDGELRRWAEFGSAHITKHARDLRERLPAPTLVGDLREFFLQFPFDAARINAIARMERGEEDCLDRSHLRAALENVANRGYGAPRVEARNLLKRMV